MFIFCAISQVVHCKDEKGGVHGVVLRPGRHNYPLLDPSKDPMLADELRVLRKIRKISFDDLLPSDVEILKSAPAGVDKTEYLAEKVLSKPSPKGRHVEKEKANAGRPRPKNQPVAETPKDGADGAKSRKVSDKG